MADEQLQTRENLLTLVRGGADPEDATGLLRLPDGMLASWMEDEAFRADLAQAERGARAKADAAVLDKAPAAWRRRRGEPLKVSLPGAPMKCVHVNNRTGGPCGNWAMRGANVCQKHGGAAPQVRRAALRRLTIAQLMERVDAPMDPLQVLLSAVAMSSALVEACRIEIGDLDSQELASAEMDGVVRRLGESIDRAARVAKTALDAGVDERQVRVAEGVAAMLAKVVAAVIDDEELALDGATRLRAREVAARHMRALPVAS